MSVPLIGVASAFAELLPTLTRWFSDDAPLKGHKRRGLVNQVIKSAQKITQQEDSASAIKVLRENPDLLLKFQEEIMRLEQSLEQSFLRDRESARDRDKAIIMQGRHNIRADLMVISAALGLIACLCVLICYTVSLPGEAVGIISTISGIFGSCLKDAYSFEFGSSRGSKTKDIANYLQHMKVNKF